MRVRHRRVAALLAGALAVLPAACSDDAGRNDGAPRRVGFVHANSELQFSAEMAEGFRSGVQQVGGVEQEVVAPPIVDGPAQLQLFQQLRGSAPDGISVFTLAPELFAEPMARARREGVPLIAVDNPPPPSSNVTLYVGNDNYEMGRQLAAAVIATLPANATGKVVVGTSTPGVPVLDQRVNGIRAEFRAALPGVRVLGPFDTKQDLAAMRQAWRALVRSNPTALAFLGTAEADGHTLADIRRETGGRFAIGAFDLSPKDLAEVKRGGLVLMSPEHFVKGAVAGRLQATAARTGKELPEGWVYTPGLLIDQKNIDEILARQASAEAKEQWHAAQIDKIITDSSFLRPLGDTS